MDRFVLVGYSGKGAGFETSERSIIYDTLGRGEAPPSAVWICGEMSTLHKL